MYNREVIISTHLYHILYKLEFEPIFSIKYIQTLLNTKI